MRRAASATCAVVRDVVCGLVCLFASAGPCALDTPPNLLSNASFEEGDYSPTGSPVGWQYDAWLPSAIFTWETGDARTGDRCVRIEAPFSNDARWIQSVDVEPRTLYFLSGWIKTEEVDRSSSDAGANLSLYGTWERSAGVYGSRDWTHRGLLFNSGAAHEVTVGARLGAWGGDLTGSAWFDDLRLEAIVPTTPHPSWKILVLIYRETDFEVTDAAGFDHHYVASMTSGEMDRAALAAQRFAEIDIPALTSGNMLPEVTIRFPERALSRLSPIGDGWWPSPRDTESERDPGFDSVFVIWDPRAVDLATGAQQWIGFGDGLAAFRGTHPTYNTMQVDAAVARGHRNVFKHEWGHSILNFFDAVGTSPLPVVSNHADASTYVNCLTGQPYVWEDETLADPIPNSIYNNDSGFTHDYYSGQTATADRPARCLGIPPEAWAFGGPVSHSGLRDERLTAGIDIKPGNDRNVVSLHGSGKIQVAVLSSESFDAPDDVDPSSLTFGARGDEDSLAFCHGRSIDVNDDGYDDLVCRFHVRRAAFRCGDTEGILRGRTEDGSAFEGSDSVRIVPRIGSGRCRPG